MQLCVHEWIGMRSKRKQYIYIYTNAHSLRHYTSAPFHSNPRVKVDSNLCECSHTSEAKRIIFTWKCNSGRKHRHPHHPHHPHICLCICVGVLCTRPSIIQFVPKHCAPNECAGGSCTTSTAVNELGTDAVFRSPEWSGR